MQSENTKSQLISATKELLLNSSKPEKITARQIASNAGVNLAMINYCFKSKDELMKIVVDEIIATEFQNFTIPEDDKLSSKEKLKKILYHISEVTIKYESITRLSIPYIILEAPIELPMLVLPYIKEHFKGLKSDSVCKMIAYEIILFFQITFYRRNDFGKYSGMNITNIDELHMLIDNQIDLLLGGIRL